MSDDKDPSDADDPPPEAPQSASEGPPGPTGAANSYDVGYCRPPPEHRFKKGERRNPKGRPKGSRNLKAMIRDGHRKLTRFQQGGKVRKLSALEVLIQLDMADALKGNEKAKARQIALAQQLAAEEEAKAATGSLAKLTAEDEAILARYLPAAKQQDPESEDET